MDKIGKFVRLVFGIVTLLGFLTVIYLFVDTIIFRVFRIEALTEIATFFRILGVTIDGLTVGNLLKWIVVFTVWEMLIGAIWSGYKSPPPSPYLGTHGLPQGITELMRRRISK